MEKPRPITRINASENGETYFDEITLATEPKNFAPPAPIVGSTSVLPATGIRFLVLPEGWQGDWHPAPSRILGIVVEGAIEEETTDGTVIHFPEGSLILGEDMGSKGHITRALKKTTLAIVHLI